MRRGSGLQVEDRLAVLDGDDAAGGERLAVADAVDLVEDRHGRVARAQEVGVQRVHARPSRSTVRAAATSAWPATWPPKTRWRFSSGARPRKMLTSIGFEVEEVDQVVERARHPPSASTAVMLAGTVAADDDAPFPGRLPLGHGHRRPPGRGRQLEQRLVGVGAQARLADASSRAATPATTTTATRGHRAARRPRLQHVPVLGRVEPHRARGRRVLAWPRSTTTGGCARAASSTASTPIVTFHHFTTPRWVAERGRLGEPATADRFARFASGPPRTSAT